MAADQPDLGEQALSKVVEVALTSQLDEVDELNVEVRTDPGQLLQGKVESVAISGKGLVMKQDLRMESLEVNMNAIAINPLGIVFGNLELTRPTDADAQIVLTEADINQAFRSTFIQDKLDRLNLDIEGQPTAVDLQDVTIQLPGKNQFVVKAQFRLENQSKVKTLVAKAVPSIEDVGYRRIGLKVLAAEGQGLTSSLILAIFEQISILLDVRNFSIPGMTLQLHRIQVQPGKLLIDAKTQIQSIPS
ncbi:MAG: DUF2993 domain-containing protein [Oculatellaceae cyanobacterium Prado106]|jgi:hypothetical protein|nr:DUF2993 domain-containing protein [Oculatellaceae cyanobacterium Prado106]